MKSIGPFSDSFNCFIKLDRLFIAPEHFIRLPLDSQLQVVNDFFLDSLVIILVCQLLDQPPELTLFLANINAVSVKVVVLLLPQHAVKLDIEISNDSRNLQVPFFYQFISFIEAISKKELLLN